MWTLLWKNILKLKAKCFNHLLESHKLYNVMFSKSHDNSKVSKIFKRKPHQSAFNKIVAMIPLSIIRWAEVLSAKIKSQKL